MSNEKSICPICGEPTYLVYGKSPRKDGLCGKHSQQFFNKLIYQCPDCGKWNKTGEDCECKKPVEKYTYLPYSGFEKCVLCGKESLGYAYCRSCWGNYSNEGLLAFLNDKSVDISQYELKKEESSSNDTNDENVSVETNDNDKFHMSCLFCGKDSGHDHFCNECSQKYKGTFLQFEFDDPESVETLTEESDAPSKKCIICNEDSGSYMFCKKCFVVHQNKHLLFHIKVAKDQELDLLDESYEGMYRCKDGHVVKSKSEREIDNYFFENKIAHAYEKAIVVDYDKKEFVYPDFYLSELDVYLEHWGFDDSNVDYTKSKEHKLAKYKQLGLTVISTTEADMKDYETILDYKLKSFKRGEIN